VQPDQIPQEVHDALKVDGATGIKKLIYAALPLQLPIALVPILFGIVFTATDMAVVYTLTNAACSTRRRSSRPERSSKDPGRLARRGARRSRSSCCPCSRSSRSRRSS
jgi:hypothetical protein